jgi:hypothetical protein
MQFHSQDAGGFRAAPNQLIRRHQCCNPSAGRFTTLRKTKYSRAERKITHTANLCNLEVFDFRRESVCSLSQRRICGAFALHVMIVPMQVPLVAVLNK